MPLFKKQTGILTIKEVFLEDDLQKIIDVLQLNKKGIRKIVVYIQKERQQDDEIFASGHCNSQEVIGALEFAKNKIISDDLD